MAFFFHVFASFNRKTDLTTYIISYVYVDNIISVHAIHASLYAHAIRYEKSRDFAGDLSQHSNQLKKIFFFSNLLDVNKQTVCSYTSNIAKNHVRVILFI